MFNIIFHIINICLYIILLSILTKINFSVKSNIDEKKIIE
jgi:hypothetical protein